MADVFGNAITAYFNGETNATILVRSENFEDDAIPVSYLFRDHKDMPKLERIALSKCRGKILDVGCSAGSHALYLQNTLKLDVKGIDTSQGSIDIAEKRGLLETQCVSFNNAEGIFDTVLLLMNGTGIIGTLQDIPEFFETLKGLLQPSGQVLIDSSDLIYLYEPGEEVKGYYGQMRYELEYDGKRSEAFDWLFLDKENLTAEAQIHGFNCEILFEGDHYEYLARLSFQKPNNP